jgi:hypothetical protein
VALSFGTTAWHAAPVQVPRLKPITSVEVGASVVSVTVTVPAAVAVKGNVTPPFRFNVPLNVSVTVGVVVVGVVGVGVVVSLLSLQPARPVVSANSRMPGSKRRISSP